MIIEHIKLFVLNRSFLLGFLLCIVLLAKYIFGSSNLYEDIKIMMSSGSFAEEQTSKKESKLPIYKSLRYMW